MIKWTDKLDDITNFFDSLELNYGIRVHSTTNSNPPIHFKKDKETKWNNITAAKKHDEYFVNNEYFIKYNESSLNPIKYINIKLPFYFSLSLYPEGGGDSCGLLLPDQLFENNQFYAEHFIHFFIWERFEQNNADKRQNVTEILYRKLIQNENIVIQQKQIYNTLKDKFQVNEIITVEPVTTKKCGFFGLLGGKPEKKNKLIKTSEKITIKNRSYIVYKGPRGGNYICQNKQFKLIRNR